MEIFNYLRSVPAPITDIPKLQEVSTCVCLLLGVLFCGVLVLVCLLWSLVFVSCLIVLFFSGAFCLLEWISLSLSLSLSLLIFCGIVCCICICIPKCWLGLFVYIEKSCVCLICCVCICQIFIRLWYSCVALFFIGYFMGGYCFDCLRFVDNIYTLLHSTS